MMSKVMLRLFGSKKIASVESVTLTLRGMRGSTVYEIVNDTEQLELRFYREFYSNGESVLKLENSTVVDTCAFIEFMNNCGVIRWDGFHGKHPRNVKDGIMFSFTAIVNTGQTIRADGSENFPKGYREFVRGLNNMLEKTNAKAPNE